MPVIGHAQTALMTNAMFTEISELVKKQCGINLHDGKKELIKARLSKRLRALNLGGFDQYIEFVRADESGAELTSMLDVLSTNLTSFFREGEHFQYLADKVLPEIASRAGGERGRRIRLWSAGCSSGEEPYCLAMVLRETLADIDSWDAKILATDLSTGALSKATAGLYPGNRVEAVPINLRRKYFKCVSQDGQKTYGVTPALREMVSFARLNLMESWPMQGPFDTIFCRNVMIYFDKPTQSMLVNRFWDMLGPGGVLFIGHSESLTGVRHKFRYVQPTVYQKP